MKSRIISLVALATLLLASCAKETATEVNNSKVVAPPSQQGVLYYPFRRYIEKVGCINDRPGNCTNDVIVYGDKQKLAMEKLEIAIANNTVAQYFSDSTGSYKDLFDLKDYMLNDLRSGVVTAILVPQGHDTYSVAFVNSADNTQEANW